MSRSTIDQEIRELDELFAEDVRAMARRPEDGFTARLEGRLAQGFPSASTPVRPKRRRTLLWTAGPVVAAAGVIAIVGVANLGPGDDRGPGVSGGGVALTQDPGAAEGGPADSTAATGPVGGGLGRAAPPAGAAPDAGSAPLAPAPAPERLTGTRAVERSAEIGLLTSSDELQAVATGVVRETQAAGGYVAASNVRSEDDGGEATFTLRLPSGRLDATLTKLSALADVGSLDQQARDITGPVDLAADRLSDARAERRGVQRALARATTERQIRVLRVRLGQARSQVAQLTGELRAVRRRADLATVSVTVTAGQGAPAEEDQGGAWTPGDAADDAVRVLELAAGVFLVGAAVLLPLVLLGAAGTAAGRRLQRRRRDAALA